MAFTFQRFNVSTFQRSVGEVTPMLRFLTAGESHGKALTAVVEGLPAGLAVSEDDINAQMLRRQQGYGRGGRVELEADRGEMRSGLVGGQNIVGPVSLG